MNRNFLRVALFGAAVSAVAGCDQLSEMALGPPPAVSAPASEAQPEIAIVDLRRHAGTLYSDFSADEGARYSPEQIGLNAVDRARLWRTMASPSVGQIEHGGGAEALVFRGCAEVSCEEGASVVAIDVATGTTFVAVRDSGGSVVMASNDRVEALLRLNSPTRAWDDPAPAQTASTETAQP